MVYIYVLKLIKGKYYVGKTSNPRFRLDNHFNKNGSEWTRVYKPINIHQIIPDCDDYDEDKYTIKTMEKYGINNVRGGSFCQIKLSSENKKTLERMINGSSNSCYKCGEKDHFANRCSYESDEESDEELTIEELEEAFKSLNKEEGSYEFRGETYIWKDDMLWEESPHERVGARDGTIYCSRFEYIRPVKKSSYKSSNSSKCYRCGRKGHYSNNCYASKHVKGYYLK